MNRKKEELKQTFEEELKIADQRYQNLYSNIVQKFRSDRKKIDKNSLNKKIINKEKMGKF